MQKCFRKLCIATIWILQKISQARDFSNTDEEMFYKIVVLKSFARFKGKQLHQNMFVT